MNLFKMKTDFVVFGNYTYRLNFEKLKEVCLTSSKDCTQKEIEITQNYQLDDDDELNIVEKTEHEVKMLGNSQNDMIIYDIFKLLLVSLLENDSTINEFKPTFGTSLAINTLIGWGVLEKIN